MVSGCRIVYGVLLEIYLISSKEDGTTLLSIYWGVDVSGIENSTLMVINVILADQNVRVDGVCLESGFDRAY